MKHQSLSLITIFVTKQVSRPQYENCFYNVEFPERVTQRETRFNKLSLKDVKIKVILDILSVFPF